jgi:hypothetical protein
VFEDIFESVSLMHFLDRYPQLPDEALVAGNATEDLWVNVLRPSATAQLLSFTTVNNISQSLQGPFEIKNVVRRSLCIECFESERRLEERGKWKATDEPIIARLFSAKTFHFIFTC